MGFLKRIIFGFEVFSLGKKDILTLIKKKKKEGYLQLTDYYLVKILGLFLPAVVRPILDSFEASKQVPQPALNDVSI